MTKHTWEIKGESVFFSNGFVFHISFSNWYKGLDVIQCRRKLKQFYTRGEQDMIIAYLKANHLIKISK